MITVLLVIHLLVTMALVGIVLVQRSEGGVLGIGGGGGGGGVMSGRAAGNVLTRATWILAAAFFVLSIALAVLSNSSAPRKSIFDDPALAIPPAGQVQPGQAPAAAPAAPAQPAVPAPPAR